MLDEGYLLPCVDRSIYLLRLMLLLRFRRKHWFRTVQFLYFSILQFLKKYKHLKGNFSEEVKYWVNSYFCVQDG